MSDTETTTLTLASVNDTITAVQVSMDNGWTIFGGVLVFIMHAGFALLEAGTVRHKNILNILQKNIFCIAIGAIGWFLLGYGIAFGKDDGSGMIGTDHFAVTHNELKTKDGSFLYAFWFFQFTFCATAATIVSGAVAERCTLLAFIIFTTVLTNIIYPIIVHWTWGGGWLAEEGYSDFAGSGVVHMTGGIAGLIGAIALGPRLGKFPEEGEKIRTDEFNPSNVAYISLGTLLLWFGWFGFNAGSTVALSGTNAEIAGHCATTTTLAGAAGGLVAFALFRASKGKFDVTAFLNGTLAGLVSITAGTNNIDTHVSILVGSIGAVILFAVDYLFNQLGMKSKVKIDDPLNAFAVHGACGMWGVLAVGLFDLDSGVAYGNGADVVLIPNVTGIVAITAYVGTLSAIMWFALKATGQLRVSRRTELMGIDIHEYILQREESINFLARTKMNLDAAELESLDLESLGKPDSKTEKTATETDKTDTPAAADTPTPAATST